jgi:hypothetical protein
MTRNLKALGVALIAVFAMSAVATGVAQAKFDTLRTSPTTESVIFTGSALGTPQFSLGTKATVKCGEVNLEKASVNLDKATSVTAYPIFNKTENTCEVAPFGKATVHMNGCYIKSTGETDASELAEIHLVCPPEKSIEITAPVGCTIKVGTQTVRGWKYANKGEGETGMWVEVIPQVSGIAYTSTAPCQLIGLKASATDGVYQGNLKVTAHKNEGGEPGGAVGITTETLETETMP